MVEQPVRWPSWAWVRPSLCRQDFSWLLNEVVALVMGDQASGSIAFVSLRYRHMLGQSVIVQRRHLLDTCDAHVDQNLSCMDIDYVAFRKKDVGARALAA